MGILNNRPNNEAVRAPRFAGVSREVAAQVAVHDLQLLDAAVVLVESAADISEHTRPELPLSPNLVREPWRDQQAA